MTENCNIKSCKDYDEDSSRNCAEWYSLEDSCELFRKQKEFEALKEEYKPEKIHSLDELINTACGLHETVGLYDDLSKLRYESIKWAWRQCQEYHNDTTIEELLRFTKHEDWAV